MNDLFTCLARSLHSDTGIIQPRPLALFAPAIDVEMQSATRWNAGIDSQTVNFITNERNVEKFGGTPLTRPHVSERPLPGGEFDSGGRISANLSAQPALPVPDRERSSRHVETGEGNVWQNNYAEIACPTIDIQTDVVSEVPQKESDGSVVPTQPIAKGPVANRPGSKDAPRFTIPGMEHAVAADRMPVPEPLTVLNSPLDDRRDSIGSDPRDRIEEVTAKHCDSNPAPSHRGSVLNESREPDAAGNGRREPSVVHRITRTIPSSDSRSDGPRVVSAGTMSPYDDAAKIADAFAQPNGRPAVPSHDPERASERNSYWKPIVPDVVRFYAGRIEDPAAILRPGSRELGESYETDARLTEPQSEDRPADASLERILPLTPAIPAEVVPEFAMMRWQATPGLLKHGLVDVIGFDEGQIEDATTGLPAAGLHAASTERMKPLTSVDAAVVGSILEDSTRAVIDPVDVDHPRRSRSTSSARVSPGKNAPFEGITVGPLRSAQSKPPEISTRIANPILDVSGSEERSERREPVRTNPAPSPGMPTIRIGIGRIVVRCRPYPRATEPQPRTQFPLADDLARAGRVDR